MPRLQIMKTLLLITFCCFAMSCVLIHPGSESAFRVKGAISQSPTVPSQQCLLEVFRADTHKIVGHRTIKPEFDTSMIIAPGVHKYYMIVSCSGTPTKYKSPVFELGDAQHYMQPLDLGTITLSSEGPPVAGPA